MFEHSGTNIIKLSNQNWQMNTCFLDMVHPFKIGSW